MPKQANHDTAEFPPPGRHAWAVVCCVLGVTSLLLLGPLALSFFLGVDAWLYQWDVLPWLYLLGPEIVLALVALIAGIIVIARWRKTSGWKYDGELVTAGLTCAVLVLIFYGSVLWVGIRVLAGVAL
jgi:hypothetical protein